MASSEPNGVTLDSYVVAATDQITSQLADESVILNLDDGMYYGLDPIGTRIWALVERPRAVREICDRIQEVYNVSPADCEEAVLALMRDMTARGLVKVER